MKKLEQIQRRMALRVCCAYRTAGSKAAHVVSGIPPIDLLITEQCQIHNGEDKAVCRQALLDTWSDRWSREHSWTAKIIRNLNQWISRQHGDVNYWLSQFLTGHGIYASYLKRIGKKQTDICWYCEDSDDAQHTFFHCSRWETQRETCWRVIGQQTPDTIVEAMLESQAAWHAVETMVSNILFQKAADERQWQQQQRQRQ